MTSVPASALRRARPLKGDVATAVLGSNAGQLCKVLSEENGVAVVRMSIRSAAATEPTVVVRVLPLDALCRVDVR